jgi:hypothetical protein
MRNILFSVLVLVFGITIGVAAQSFPTFTDVPVDSWYAESVKNLQEKRIVEGYDDNTYRPANNVTRAEMAVMLDRLSSDSEQSDALIWNISGLLTDYDYAYFLMKARNELFYDMYKTPFNEDDNQFIEEKPNGDLELVTDINFPEGFDLYTKQGIVPTYYINYKGVISYGGDTPFSKDADLWYGNYYWPGD